MTYHYTTIKVANKTDNPLINLILAINGINYDSLPVFNYLLNKTDYDINEKIYFYHRDNDKLIITENNILNILQTLNNNNLSEHHNNQFYKTLFNKGLKIEAQNIYTFIYGTQNEENFQRNLGELKLPFDEITEYIKNSKNVQTTQKHPLFNYEQLSDRQLIVFKEASEQLKDDYLRLIQENKTYHYAVKYSKDRIVALFNSQSIPVNLLDENGATPLMYAESLDDIKLLEELGANWLIIDNNNKDATAYYAEIEDKDFSKLLMTYAESKVKELIKENNLNNDYLSERNAMQLISLVNGNKTKAELKSFINKNKINNISNIIDNDGNNLMMLSIQKENWSRACLFLEYMDEKSLNQTNKNGETALDLLLDEFLYHPPNSKQAKPLIEKLFQHQHNKKDQEGTSFFAKILNNLIHKNIFSNIGIRVPKILLNNATFPLLSNLGFDLTAGDYHERNFDRGFSESNVQLKRIFNFYIDGFKIEKENNPNINFILDIDHFLNQILTKKVHDYSTKINYNIDEKLFNELVFFVKTFDENFSNNKLTNELTLKLNEKIISFINDSLEEVIENHPNQPDVIKGYKYTIFENASPLFLFLIYQNNFDFFDKLDQDILNHDFQNDNINKIAEYKKMQKTLSKKTDKLTNKIIKV